MDEDELRFEDNEDDQEYRDGEDELREYGWQCNSD